MSEAKARHRLVNKVLSSAENVSIDAIIYLDIIEEHFKNSESSISREDALKVAHDFHCDIEKEKQLTDWKVKEDIQSSIEFNLVLALEPYNLNELYQQILVSKLIQQAKMFN